MTSLPSLFRRHAAWLVVLAMTWLMAACGGRTEDSTALPTLTGGAAGANAAGKAGAGAGGTAGASGKAGAGAGGAAGTAGKAGAGGSAGKSGSGGASGSGGGAGKSGAAGTSGAGGMTATIVSVTVAPAKSTVSIGTSVALTATALGSDGSKQDVTKTATWSSSSPTVKVASGTATGVSAGSATITATFSGKSGTADVTVSTATPTKLTVAPMTATLGVSGTQQLSATLLLSDGSSQDVTKTATWASTQASVADVSATGLVTAKAAGTTDVKASLSGLGATATITVTAATLDAIAISPSNPTVIVGSAQQLTATGTFSDGTVGDVSTTVTWSSTDAGLTVSSTGLAQALAAGTSIVTASLGGVSGSTTVTMTTSKVQSIAVSPSTASVAAGGTTQLTAIATFADGSTSDVTGSATWQSSAPTTVSVSNAAGSSGLVTGLASGGATITASLGGASGAAKITVINGTLVSLAISPASPSVPLGASMQLTATGTFSDGSTIDETSAVTWTIDDAAIATVGNAPSSGKLSGVAIGTATVTVSVDGVTATATVTVTNATLASVVVSPASLSLASGKKQDLTATAVFSDGSMLDVTEQAVWSSSSTSVATVSNATGVRGQVSAVAAGSATITATYQGQAGTAALTVTQPVVSQLAISPTNQTRAVGQQQQFQAVAIFDNGTQQNVTLQASWSSSDASIASINMMGRVNAVSTGKVTITATWNGLSASTTFSVSDPVLQQITVSPINPKLVVGTNVPFSAVAIYTDGTSMNVGNQCSWSSDAPSVATVNTGMGPMKGLVTPVSPGTADITCNYQGLSGSSTVTVSAAVVDVLVISPGAFTGGVGSMTQFTAQIIYNDGTSMDVTQQSTWVSDAVTIATVTTGGGGPMGMGPRGQATGVSPGTATITATYMGLSATTTFTVSASTLTSIAISPPDATSPVGVNVKLSATAIYSDGSSQDVTNQTTWVSSDPSIAGVSNAMGNQKGLVTPIAMGKVTITATALGLSGTTSFTVASATLVSIEVTPFAPTLPVGYLTPFFATGIYSDATTVDLTNLVTWQSTATSVASVSNGGGTKGRVTPVAAGSASIDATYAGVTGSSAVTVTDAQLLSITIAPADPSLKVGQTTQMAAMGDFGGGLSIDITNYVTWSSSDTAVLAVSNATNTHGQAKGLSVGAVTITATKGAVTASTSATVN